MSGAKQSLKKAASEEGQERGPLVPIRKLIEAGQTGLLAIGKFEGKKESEFTYKNKQGKEVTKTSVEYWVRGDDDTLYIFPNAQAVRTQLEDVAVGTKIEAQFNGVKETKSGNTYHDYEFFVVA